MDIIRLWLLLIWLYHYNILLSPFFSFLCLAGKLVLAVPANRMKRNGQPANYWWIPGASNNEPNNINTVSCGDPGSPNHGSSLFESVNAGSIVVHSCDPGHRLVGAKLRLCQSNGQWTPELPQCVCKWSKISQVTLLTLGACAARVTVIIVCVCVCLSFPILTPLILCTQSARTCMKNCF